MCARGSRSPTPASQAQHARPFTLAQGWVSIKLTGRPWKIAPTWLHLGNRKLLSTFWFAGGMCKFLLGVMEDRRSGVIFKHCTASPANIDVTHTPPPSENATLSLETRDICLLCKQWWELETPASTTLLKF